MKPQTKIDKLYLSVFEEMQNPKWKMSHIWYFLPLMTKSIHVYSTWSIIWKMSKLWDNFWEINILIKNPNLLLSYYFAQINLHFRYENNPIPTNFWLFARTTMKYLWMGWMYMLRHIIEIQYVYSLCIFHTGIYRDMFLNYSKTMSLFKNYEILHLWWTRSGEVGSLEIGYCPPPPTRRSATDIQFIKYSWACCSK